MQFAWTANCIVLDGSRSGYLEYRQYGYFNGKYKATIKEDLYSKNVVETGIPYWGMKVQLRANTMVNAYENFKTYADIKVAPKESGNVGLGYSHQKFGGSIGLNVGIVSGDIEFNTSGNTEPFFTPQLEMKV